MYNEGRNLFFPAIVIVQPLKIFRMKNKIATKTYLSAFFICLFEQMEKAVILSSTAASKVGSETGGRRQCRRFKPINEQLWAFSLKGKWFNITLIIAHVPTKEKSDEDKADFHLLENQVDSSPSQDIKIFIGEGRDFMPLYRPTCNEITVRLASFAASENIVISSTKFPRRDVEGNLEITCWANRQSNWSCPNGPAAWQRSPEKGGYRSRSFPRPLPSSSSWVEGRAKSFRKKQLDVGKLTIKR